MEIPERRKMSPFGMILMIQLSTALQATTIWPSLRDKRQARCVQLYFVQPNLRSPVYSLDFDSSEMYAALDTSVLGFDFSGGHRKPVKDLVVYSCNWFSTSGI